MGQTVAGLTGQVHVEGARAIAPLDAVDRQLAVVISAVVDLGHDVGARAAVVPHVVRARLARRALSGLPSVVVVLRAEQVAHVRVLPSATAADEKKSPRAPHQQNRSDARTKPRWIGRWASVSWPTWPLPTKCVS